MEEREKRADDVIEGEVGIKRPSGGAAEAMPKTPFNMWLENYWYHYKWHTIVGAFIIVVLTVIVAQMCTRTTYDAYIVYAGNYEIKKTASGGNSPYGEAIKSLGRVTEDFDGDGEKNVSFNNLFVVNEAERDQLLLGTTNLEINESLVREDTEMLESLIVYSDYYVFFLSERLFREYEAVGEGVMFVPVDEFTDPSIEYEYPSAHHTGVYLRSLPFGKLPTFSDLPEDTVVCLRYINDFKKKQSEEKYEESKIVFENILSYK